MSVSRRYPYTHKKYSVGSSPGRSAFTDTLEEAKQEGQRIAKLEAWRGKWNLTYLTIVISKQAAPGSMFYRPVGLRMYVPVRGTGKRAEDIIAEIKRHHGVAPFVWTKK